MGSAWRGHCGGIGGGHEGAGSGLSDIIPIYGHMTMRYAHIWSYDHALYPYMVIRGGRGVD